MAALENPGSGSMAFLVQGVRFGFRVFWLVQGLQVYSFRMAGSGDIASVSLLGWPFKAFDKYS